MSKLIVSESPAQITNVQKVEKNNVSIETAQMIELLDSIDYIYQGPYGLWIISQSSILFHSTIHELSISMVRPTDLPFITQHMSSREIILLNNKGDIYSCYPNHNEVQQKLKLFFFFFVLTLLFKAHLSISENKLH